MMQEPAVKCNPVVGQFVLMIEQAVHQHVIKILKRRSVIVVMTQLSSGRLQASVFIYVYPQTQGHRHRNTTTKPETNVTEMVERR